MDNGRTPLQTAVFANAEGFAADLGPVLAEARATGHNSLRADTAVTLLEVSHNLAVVRLIADQVALMHRGRIVEQGDCATVLQIPQADYTQQLLASWPRARHVGGAVDRDATAPKSRNRVL